MKVPDYLNETTAKYHFHYLCEVFRYRRIRYSKSNPKAVAGKEYFNGMLERIEKTTHLDSFRRFIQFIIKENELMK